MSLPTTSPPTTPPPGTTPQVTAPSGTGLVVIPGVPSKAATTVVAQPSRPPSLPGSQDDPADFYGLGGAVALVVVTIFLVRRLLPLRRQPAEGRHPTQPPEGTAPRRQQP